MLRQFMKCSESILFDGVRLFRVIKLPFIKEYTDGKSTLKAELHPKVELPLIGFLLPSGATVGTFQGGVQIPV